MPKIHNYRDYRDYLGDWFKANKATNARMSFRYVARHLGLSSPNHFQLVITKKRHFSKGTLDRMQRLLRLRPKERSYLDLLYTLAHTNAGLRRDEIESKVARLGSELMESDISIEHYAVLANSLAWYLKMGALRFSGKTALAIRKLVLEACPFKVEPTAVDAALELLLRIGAAKKDGDLFIFDIDNLKTAWDFDDQKVKQFHYNNLMLAMHTIPWPIDHRFFSNVTVPCNAVVIEAAKKEVRDLCLKLLNLSNSEVTTATECEQVVSLQFAMFPYFTFDRSKAAPHGQQ